MCASALWGWHYTECSCVAVQGGLLSWARLGRRLNGSRRRVWQFSELLPCLFSLKSKVVIHIQRDCKVMAENLKRLKGQATPQPNSPGGTTALGVC